MTLRESNISRPWYRLHAVTILVGCAMTAAMILIIVPGELSFQGGGGSQRYSYQQNYAHGWPWQFADRVYVQSGASSSAFSHKDERWPWWSFADSWNFKGKISDWSGRVLGLDLVVGAAIVLVVMSATEIWRRRRRRATQIGIRGSLAALSVLACMFWWLRGHQVASQYDKQFAERTDFTVTWEYCGPEWLSRLIGRDWELFRHATGWSAYGNERALIAEFAPHLNYLKTFYCDDAGLTPQDVEALAACQRLRRIMLIEVPMSDEMFAAVAKNRRLESLLIQECGEFNSSAIALLRSLRHLSDVAINVGATSDTNLLIELSAFARLEALSVVHVPESDGGLHPLAKLTRLNSLTIGGNAITDDELKHLCSLQHLEELNLLDAEIHDVGLRHLVGLSHLRWLNLNRCPINDEGAKWLARVTSLELLDLGNTKITDAGLKDLEKLTRLKFLVIEGTSTSPIARQEFQDAMRDVELQIAPRPGPPF